MSMYPPIRAQYMKALTNERRELTPDDVDPGGGGVAHTGLTGVKAGVPQAGLLDQQEGGGRRA